MTSQLLRIVRVGLLAALAFCVVAPTHAFAQDASKPEASTAQSADQKNNAQVPAKVKDEEEKSGESESGWAKQSSSVKWFAKKTGLTLDQTYWLCFIINFAIIFFFLAHLMRKKLPGFFQGRTSAIQKGIE